ncbi:DsbA family protein [Halobacterium wangiae]|uniref:DsbA family protein n=1 Tax=Halobacterium wangiae TaxID=2902623 RepID=UPI001E3D150F|nr:DsbA family protein [Halobacterium wangiae]
MSRFDETTRRGFVAAGGVIAITGGVAYAATTHSPGSSDSASAALHSSTETTSIGLDLTDHPIMGSMDAPVDIYYYSDYQCPFCGQFEQNTLPKLVSNDVQSGDVRLVFVQYPYIGQASTMAAVLDRAVWRQVRESDPQAWWRWHETLFDEQGEPNSGWASRENLLAVAEDVDGVDANAVESYADDHADELRDEVGDDVAEGAEFGVRASPSFVVARRGTERAGRIVGAQPYSRFQEGIERVRDE